MSQSQRLAAHRAATKPNNETVDEPEDEEIEEPDASTSNGKDKKMTDTNTAAVETAKKEGHDSGFKAANDRMNAVFASEHYAGREALAAKMLGKPGLSAEDIIDVLASTPKAASSELSAEEQRTAAEEAARTEMQAAIKNGGGGSDVGPDAPPRKEANHGWAEIHAEVRARRGA